MDKNLLHWILNEMNEERLRNICEEEKIKIAGFSRSKQKAPKNLLITNLLKNKIDLIRYLKKYIDISKEKNEFENKSVLEIEALIDINQKDKMIKQVIYLLTSDTEEHTELVTILIKKAIQEENKENISIAAEKEHNENIKKIEELNETLKIQETKLVQLKNQNNILTIKNQGLNTDIKAIKKECNKNEIKYKSDIRELNKVIDELKKHNEDSSKKSTETLKMSKDNVCEKENADKESLEVENKKKILIIGSNNIEELDIPKHLRISIDTLKDTDNIFDDKYISKYNIIWVFVFNISTQTEAKLNKIKINTNTIRFNSIIQFKNYIRKEAII